MRFCNVGFVVAVMLLLGCAQTRAPDLSDAHAESGAVPLDPSDTYPVTGTARGTSDECEDYQTEAHQLLEAAEQCSGDNDCVTAGIEGYCLLPFVCPTPVNRTAVDHLQSEAGRLSAAYRSCSNSCAIASCVYPAGKPATCNPSTKRCELTSTVSRMPEAGSGRPDASVDQGNMTDASQPKETNDDDDAQTAPDPRFSCTMHSDCAIKNVGNCCGYYPRCVNKDAEITPVTCPPGVGGVCGFPDITSCECRSNNCVSLQDGREI